MLSITFSSLLLRLCAGVGGGGALRTFSSLLLRQLRRVFARVIYLLVLCY